MERAVLVRVNNPGDVVVDGGANIGIYAQFLARRVGDTGIVHAFEPDAENFARLQAAVGGLKNVRLSRTALAEVTGESLLYLSDDLNVDHRAYPTAGSERRSVTIGTTRLDVYFAAGARVDFIKLDIQGYELHALRGGERVLQDNPNVCMLLEFWPYGLRQAGSNWSDLIAYLVAQRMEVYMLSSNGLVPFASTHVSEEPHCYHNLLAGRLEALRW